MRICMYRIHNTGFFKPIGLLLCLLAFSTGGYSQLFPGLEGQELIDALREEYTPGQLLTEAQVKDTLYARVFIENDSVRCIYSDLARYLPQAVDPSQWLYGSGLEVNSINLEHSWPQANGAGKGTNGNRDMHHLFPSRTEINSVRGNYPFAEIQDATTQKWFYLGLEMNTIPVTQVDQYSEYRNGFFEPREASKGDIARALMYFWTIYHDDAVAAAPLFFDLQRDNLCQWHEEDPADDFELLRTERIASYQDGKPNPFIVDCSLAKRTYCPELSECAQVGFSNLQSELIRLEVDQMGERVRLHAPDMESWRVQVVDSLGKVVREFKLVPNEWSVPLDIPAGLYFITASIKSGFLTQKVFWP